MLFISMAAEKVFDRQCAGEWWRVVCPTTIDGQASRRNVYINALLHETTHTADAYPAQRRWWWWRQMEKKYRDLSPPPKKKKKIFRHQYVSVGCLFYFILRKIKYEEIAAYFSIFSCKSFVFWYFSFNLSEDLSAHAILEPGEEKTREKNSSILILILLSDENGNVIQLNFN